jgi:hypothetical protein
LIERDGQMEAVVAYDVDSDHLYLASTKAASDPPEPAVASFVESLVYHHHAFSCLHSLARQYQGNEAAHFRLLGAAAREQGPF